MSSTLLPALSRRFADHADALPALVELFEAGEPLPFLLRYRPDALQGLSVGQFRRLRDAWAEERELDRRRQAARQALAELGEVPEDIAARIDSTRDHALLEDIVRPIRESRRARKNPAAAIEDPMTPVAREILLGQGEKTLDELLAPFCGEGEAGPTVESQRERLKRLVADVLAANPIPRSLVRDALRKHGVVKSKRSPRKNSGYDEVASLDQPLASLKGPTVLLARRAQRQNAIDLSIELPEERRNELLTKLFEIDPAHRHADLLQAAAADALDRVLVPAAGSAVFLDLKRAVERKLLPRIRDVGRQRLLAGPAGAVPVLAVVPGAIGSCRLTVVDAEGNPGRTEAVHPLPPRGEEEEAARILGELLTESGAKLIAVAGSRKARAVRTWLERAVEASEHDAVPVPVNEAAAIALAKTESKADPTGELPVSVRASVSLGRFLQDPLFEACRYDLTELPLDPHQRDLHQGDVRDVLDEIVENGLADVGVPVNVVGASVLARVPGLTQVQAEAIVAHRAEHGPFASRVALREVEGMTEEAWQRAVGFLRVRHGTNPLDATGVHPTGEDVARAIAEARGVSVADLIGDETLRGLDPAAYTSEVHTDSDVRSVLAELQRPLKDPRGCFLPPVFNAGVRRLRDVKEGMELNGVVTNLSEYGAFIDLGIRQDGLVHVSELAHRFVKDASQAVAIGERVRVKVLGIDKARRRISLSIKALLPEPPPSERQGGDERRGRGGRKGRGGRGGRQGGRDRRGPQRADIREIPKEHDPFHLQLAALRAQLGFEKPADKPKPAKKGKKAKRKAKDSAPKPAEAETAAAEAPAAAADSASATPVEAAAPTAPEAPVTDAASEPAATPETAPEATSGAPAPAATEEAPAAVEATPAEPVADAAAPAETEVPPAEVTSAEAAAAPPAEAAAETSDVADAAEAEPSADTDPEKPTA